LKAGNDLPTGAATAIKKNPKQSTRLGF